MLGITPMAANMNILGHLRVDLLPQLLVDDGFMLSRVGVLFVWDFAKVDTVPQNLIESATRVYPLPSGPPAEAVDPDLAPYSCFLLKMLLQLPDTAEFDI